MPFFDKLKLVRHRISGQPLPAITETQRTFFESFHLVFQWYEKCLLSGQDEQDFLIAIAVSADRHDFILKAIKDSCNYSIFQKGTYGSISHNVKGMYKDHYKEDCKLPDYVIFFVYEYWYSATDSEKAMLEDLKIRSDESKALAMV